MSDTPTQEVEGSEIRAGLLNLGERFRAEFAAARTEHALRAARGELLGKTGQLTTLLKGLGKLPAESRPLWGDKLNAVRREVEAEFESRLAALLREAREEDLNGTPFDLSLPGRLPSGRGHVHPLMQVRDEVLDVFASLGFRLAWGPEVEAESNNFTKLAFPPDHPATDMQDSFWVRVLGGESSARVLLRTHTSNVQSREMSRSEPPLAVVSGGRVYRRDDDVTHSPMFHQIEGFLVDEHVSFAHLKGVLTAFARRLYGESAAVRFRPSYFPFVEPGAEVDVGCVFCRPDDGSRSGCRVCKATGWLEILGCGMIHPRVFEACGIDAERFSGFAFGLGVERVAMLRYGVPDIRLLYENHPRFLSQF